MVNLLFKNIEFLNINMKAAPENNQHYSYKSMLQNYSSQWLITSI